MKQRKKTRAARVLLSFLAAILMIAAVLLISNLWLTVSRYEVISPKIPDDFDGFKILQLSDLHNASFGRDNARLLTIIDREDPNIVVMTGDMTGYGENGFEPFLSLCRRLAEVYPSYYIPGNHEYWMHTPHFKGLVESITDTGVQPLLDDKVMLTRGGEHIWLYGSQTPDYYSRGDAEMFAGNLERAFGEKKPDVFTILLKHTPKFFESYALWGADLTFAGHVHGGVIRFPFIGGVLSPDRQLFPQYSHGRYIIGESEMIVSRGLGNAPSRLLRFGSLPEVVVVTLRTVQ